MTETANYLHILLLDSRQKEFESVIALLAEINAINTFPYSLELLYTKGIDKGLELIEKQQIDLILLDVSTAKNRALSSIGQIKTAHPNTPIITIIPREDPDFAHSIIEGGAHDAFALSTLSATHFAKCMRQALEQK